MKKWIAAGLLILAILVGLLWPREIGRVYGPEHEWIEIRGTVYEQVTDGPYGRAHRGRCLGTVRNGKNTMTVYEVEEDSSFLYVRWEWEGCIYKRIEQ